MFTGELEPRREASGDLSTSHTHTHTNQQKRKNEIDKISHDHSFGVICEHRWAGAHVHTHTQHPPQQAGFLLFMRKKNILIIMSFLC